MWDVMIVGVLCYVPAEDCFIGLLEIVGGHGTEEGQGREDEFVVLVTFYGLLLFSLCGCSS